MKTCGSFLPGKEGKLKLIELSLGEVITDDHRSGLRELPVFESLSERELIDIAHRSVEKSREFLRETDGSRERYGGGIDGSVSRSTDAKRDIDGARVDRLYGVGGN